MERTLAPGRPALILTIVLGAVLAFVPLAALAAGVGANELFEACRAITGVA